MGQALMEIISNLVDISGIPIVDTILFAAIALISFSVAFSLVGRIFDALKFYDSDLMSGVHWIIRLAVFVGLTYALVKTFQFITWLLSFHWWVYLIAMIIVIIIIGTLYAVKYKIRKDNNLTKTETIRKQNLEIEIKNSDSEVGESIRCTAYNKNTCPRCGSRLFNRLGPYGEFVG